MAPSKRHHKKPKSESSSSEGTSVAETPFSKPEYAVPEIPVNITDIDDRTLMSLFAMFTAWQNYAATQLGYCEVTERKTEAKVKMMEGMATLRLKPEYKTVSEAKAAMAEDPDIEKARQEALNAYSERKLTKIIYENCERNAALISRELSRRIGREPIERRNARLNP